MSGDHSSPSSIFQTSIFSQHCTTTEHPFSFFWQFTFSHRLCPFFLPLLPTSKLHLSAIAHTHAHTCSNPFKQHNPFCKHMESLTKCSLACFQGSSYLASGILPTPCSKKSKIASSTNCGWRAAAKITSSLQNNFLKTKKKKSRKRKCSIFSWGFEWEGKKILANSSLLSFSDLGKYQQDALDRVDFASFCLDLLVFSLWFWW